MSTTLGALRARTVRLADISAEDRRRWAELSGRALEPNLFLDPGYLHTAHPWRPKLRHTSLVVVEDRNSMRGLLPLSIQPRSRQLPFRHASTSGPVLRSGGPLHTPLVDKDHPRAVLSHLLQYLSSSASGLPGLVELANFPGSGPLYDTFHAVSARWRVPTIERWRFEYAVTHLGEREDWRSGLSKGRRKNLQRYARRMQTELGELEIEDCGSDCAAFDEFVELEASGWKGERGNALRRSESSHGWHRDMVEEFRARGQFHLIRLRAGGRTVYMSMTFRIADQLFNLIDAYDERFSHLRPGNVGRAAELDYFQSRYHRVTVNTCMHPRYRESTANSPDRAHLVGLLLAPRGPANKIALRAAPALRAARRAVAGLTERGRTADPPQKPAENRAAP